MTNEKKWQRKKDVNKQNKKEKKNGKTSFKNNKTLLWIIIQQ